MMDERAVREMLERRAATISATPIDPPKAVRRARRRLALNAAVGTLVALGVLVGAVAGVRTIEAAPTPADPPIPTPAPPARLGSLVYSLDGDIFVADWDGSNPVKIADRRLADECGSDGAETPFWLPEGSIWSPDGRYLAFRHTDCDGPRGSSDDGVISDPEGNVVASFPREGWAISWSPDSTRVAVWIRYGEAIGVFGVDGTRQALLTLPPGLMSDACDCDPVWSRDGASLLVPNGVVIPLDGSTPQQLPSSDPRAWQLPSTDPRAFPLTTYSPDGLRIAYTNNGSLFVADADGSDPQEVPVGEEGVWKPVWSPTGDRIAFTSTPRGDPLGGHRIGVVDVATGTVTVLAETKGPDLLFIEFSPEGDRILFARINRDTNITSLWSLEVDGSNARRVVDRADLFSADWQSLPETR